MVDPDLQIGGRGGGGGLKKICFRPFGPQFRLEIRRKGGGGRVGGRSQKNLFSALRASVSSRNKEKGGRGAGPSPGAATV